MLKEEKGSLQSTDALTRVQTLNYLSPVRPVKHLRTRLESVSQFSDARTLRRERFTLRCQNLAAKHVHQVRPCRVMCVFDISLLHPLSYPSKFVMTLRKSQNRILFTIQSRRTTSCDGNKQRANQSTLSQNELFC